MTHTFRLLLIALGAMPGAAFALGLGDIHLQSALNQPLTAQIDLVGATPEELPQLRANIAARETFQRYGIDRPAYLQNFAFKVAKDAAGHNILNVSSAAPVTEPFVTFLVEVTWPRGKLLREYTLLLDPPVFEKTPTPKEPVAAAVTGEPSTPASGAVTRPAPVETPPAATPTPLPETAPAEAPKPAAVSSIGSEYTVVRKDTLSGIVRRAGASTPADSNKMMVAIFRANSSAFNGNINRLRKGALLRIPAPEDYAGLSKSEARAEVHRQMEEWRGGAAGAAGTAGAGEPRLKLVMPSEPPPPAAAPSAQPPATVTTPAPGAVAPTGPVAPGKSAAENEAKRLMELKAEELARLQAQTAPKGGAPEVPSTTPPPTVAPGPATTPAEAPPTAAAPPAEVPPVVATPESPSAAKPKPVVLAPPREGPLDSFGYLIIAGVALVIVALLGFFYSRRRRSSTPPRRGAFESLERGAGAGLSPSLATTSRIAQEEAERSKMVVEESEDDSGEFIAPPPPRPAPRPAPIAPPPSTEDTLSSETALNLEQADPLAEADFHMAYGLYDQAADIVKLAIDREPERRDLKLKLLEVYFVWGNKDSFLEVARELAKGRDQAAAGEWDKVVIMGRQIAPEEALFAGAAPTHAGAGGVDLDLDNTGINRVDLELLGDGDLAATSEEEVVDLDLSAALGGHDSTAETGESQALDEDALDLSLDGGGGIEVTQEMAGRSARDEPTIERAAMESPTVESEVGGFRSDTPTVESPALRVHDETNPTIRAKLDAARFGAEKNRADVTSELALDDLGFDVQDIGASQSLPALEVTDHPTDHPSDAPTMLAGMDERSRRALNEAAAKAAQEPTREVPRPAGRASQEPTRELPRPTAKPAYEPTRELARPPAARADDPTTIAPHADKTRISPAPSHDDIDVDLDELSRQLEADTVQQPHRDEARFSEVFAGTGRFPASAARDVDLDVGNSTVIDRAPTVTERIATGDMGLPELEPVTLSEVGTKLDLARAYMDMGDPEGAKSILQEVMIEGSTSQKQEAQRLLGTLPG